MDLTVHARFRDVAGRNGSSPFLTLTKIGAQRLSEVSRESTYDEIAERVHDAVESFRARGFGGGHRVGLLLSNRPSHFVYLLALNSLGASAVPLNPDATSAELAYIIEHAEIDLLIVPADQFARIQAVAETCSKLPQVVLDLRSDLRPPAKSAVAPTEKARLQEACLLYTSGTTGRPKGCVITNEYFNFIGRYYAYAGGVAHLQPRQDRILNPLPVSHQNAGIFSFMGALFSENCLIMTDRFHANTWWDEVEQSGATVVHYLGVMPAILLKLPDAPAEHRRRVRFGVGAGVEPSLHVAFEKRFGIALVELWGMTETGGGFIASHEPREIDTRAFGRPLGRKGRDFEVRIVDDEDRDVAPGEQGEMLVRRLGDNPRAGMFAGYLKDQAATDHVWRHGWFHTGDVVRRNPSGMLCFVDRRKNIIRRSGENIAAAEVENVLAAHPAIERAAVFAVPDSDREEEVMACVVLKDRAMSHDAALESILAHCAENLAYHKAPGWLLFTDKLPTTGTQKVAKYSIFPDGVDARTVGGVRDLRARKRRTTSKDERRTNE